MGDEPAVMGRGKAGMRLEDFVCDCQDRNDKCSCGCVDDECTSLSASSMYRTYRTLHARFYAFNFVRGERPRSQAQSI